MENRSGSFLWQDCFAKALRGAARARESIASARAAKMTTAAEEAAIARIVADVKALEAARGGKGSTPGCAKINSHRHAIEQRRVDGVEVDATIRHEGAVNFLFPRSGSRPARRKGGSCPARPNGRGLEPLVPPAAKGRGRGHE